MKLLRALPVAAAGPTLLALGAGPAAAAGPTPVLAVHHAWFWWLAPVLVVSFVLIALALALGYFVRILRPKYRGR